MEPTTTTPIPDARKRKFTIVDLMILIAAMGAALGTIRLMESKLPSTWSDVLGDLFDGPFAESSMLVDQLADSLLLVGFTITAILGWLSLILIPIRLRKPRPSLRRIAAQPGWTACVAASVPIVVLAAFTLVYFRLYGDYDLPGSDFWPFFVFTLAIGITVLAGWVWLLVGRRWRHRKELGRSIRKGDWHLLDPLSGRLRRIILCLVDLGAGAPNPSSEIRPSTGECEGVARHLRVL